MCERNSKEDSVLAGLSTYTLKRQFQELLLPAQDLLIEKKLSPNQITSIAFTMNVIAAFSLMALERGSLLSLGLIAVFFLRMALNALDGMVAKKTNQMTWRGAVLNEVTDYLSDALFLLALAIYTAEAWDLWALLGFSVMASEFVSALVFSKPGLDKVNSGPLAKSDRTVFFGICLFLSFLPPASQWLEFALIVAVSLSLLTCFNRFRLVVAIDE